MAAQVKCKSKKQLFQSAMRHIIKLVKKRGRVHAYFHKKFEQKIGSLPLQTRAKIINEFRILTTYNRKKFESEGQLATYIDKVRQMTLVETVAYAANNDAILAFCENDLYSQVFEIALPLLKKMGYDAEAKRSQPGYVAPDPMEYLKTLDEVKLLIEMVRREKEAK